MKQGKGARRPGKKCNLNRDLKITSLTLKEGKELHRVRSQVVAKKAKKGRGRDRVLGMNQQGGGKTARLQSAGRNGKGMQDKSVRMWGSTHGVVGESGGTGRIRGGYVVGGVFTGSKSGKKTGRGVERLKQKSKGT